MTTIRFPRRTAFSAVGFEKFRYRVFDAALVSACCALRLGDDGAVADARVVVGAVHPAPVLVPGVADGPLTDAAVTEIGRRAAAEVLPEELATTPLRRYQRELVGVLVARAIARAHDRAKDQSGS
nr:hypothetical protein [Pseudonocardia acidicola]